MFCSVKIRILCIFVLFSLVHLSQADKSTIEVLKRIEKELAEFKEKYLKEQQRIRDFVSLTVRKFYGEGCFNATIETFTTTNDQDPFGNINIIKIEHDLGFLLNGNGKLAETAKTTDKQNCECEKANEIVREEMANCANEFTNRLATELKTRFAAQKQSFEEANQISQKDIMASLRQFPKRSDLACFGFNLTNRLTKEMKTRFETQNDKIQANVNATLQTLHDNFTQSQNTSLQIRDKLISYHFETLTSSQNNLMDKLEKRLTDEFKTQFEAQSKSSTEANENSYKNISASLQWVLSVIRKLETHVEAQNDNTQTSVNTKLEQVWNAVDIIPTSVKGFLNLCYDCDCAIASGNGAGIYEIHIFNKETTVYCDEFGKMMIQHQMEGSENYFNRSWIEFKNGFGALKAQYWMGLENLHLLTSLRRYELHILLLDFRNVTRRYIYNDFKIDDERNMYRIKRAYGFSEGSSADGLKHHINMPFSTIDKDFSKGEKDFSCASRFECGWWYFDNDPKYCFHKNFNVRVRKNESENESNVLKWVTGRPLKEVSMHIKIH